MAGIDSDLIRGHIDTIILKALYHGDKYGLEIIQEIEEKSNGTYELKQPTLYSCLKRLESQGLISSYWEDSEIGGKRHYYKLTEQGLATYKANQEEWLRSREIIDNLIYNTTIEYAPIYDDENEKKARLASKNLDEEIIDETEQQEDTAEETVENKETETLSSETTTPTDYQADDEQTDEFASFDNASITADSFFNSNSESASEDEFAEQSPAIIEAPQQTEPENELVSLNLDTIAEEPEVTEDDTEETEETEEIKQEDDTLLEEETQSEVTQEDDTSNDDEIYTLNSQEDDDEIYTPQEDEQEEIYSPTYINFGTNNYQEADLTSVESEPEEETPIVEQTEEPEELDTNNNYYNYNTEETAQEDNQDSVENTANAINEQYYGSTIPHASEEEINNLYRTTENYENLQAGYTDETYKQMLNELESYSSVQNTETTSKTNAVVPTLTELTEQFETEGIIVRKHTKQLKESDDSKMYIKTNQIHLVKNWMTFSVTTLCMLIVFGIMSAFKSGFTYNFAFWQFVVAIAVSLIIPAYSTVKYFINPYKKVVAKYAPRLSMLLSILITVQLILIVYCINLQLGFYSFSQENYCHLLWILPLILSFTPILQSLIYFPLYNSKRFHI